MQLSNIGVPDFSHRYQIQKKAPSSFQGGRVRKGSQPTLSGLTLMPISPKGNPSLLSLQSYPFHSFGTPIINNLQLARLFDGSGAVK